MSNNCIGCKYGRYILRDGEVVSTFPVYCDTPEIDLNYKECKDVNEYGQCKYYEKESVDD